MISVDLAKKLANLVARLGDTSTLDQLCIALESGRLQSNSTAVVRAAVAEEDQFIETTIEELQSLWRDEASGISGSFLALVLRTSTIALARRERELSQTQVVWTGPRVAGSFLRSTREVIREILRNARRDILLTGYWISAGSDAVGIVEEIIDCLALAVKRGISVTLILDERPRFDATDNLAVLCRAWPAECPQPVILTWRLPHDDQHLKLHAKVIVADGADALVTSANLTSYALDRNMEMGIRVSGAPAGAIDDHFRRLINGGILTAYTPKESA